MKCWKFCLAVLVVAALPAAALAAGNLLANPGFEADAVSNAAPVAGATGWSDSGGGIFTASDPMDPVHSGIGSLMATAGGGFSVPVAYQEFPASPGQTWDLQGYMLTPSALPADATFGLLKIVFSDGTNDLVPASASIGQINSTANPGVESLPFLDASSATDTWIFSQAQGVAPVGTTKVGLYAILVDQSAGTAYFDDIVGSVVPEPASVLLLGIAALAIAGVVRSRRVG
jgi:hypothetical protein